MKLLLETADYVLAEAARAVLLESASPMAIQKVLDRLVTLETALKITSPLSASVQKAWKVAPPANADIAPRTFMNVPRLVDVSWHVNLQIERWEVEAQFYGGDAESELDYRADVALSFLNAFVMALQENVSLSGDATEIGIIRGGEPTVGVLAWHGKGHVGFTVVIPVEVKSAVTIS